MRPIRTLAKRSILARAVLCAALLAGSLGAPAALGDEPVDWEAVSRIRAEGFESSEVMETARHLTDEIGARLTGSPGMMEANEWTRDRLAEWGLENAKVEAWGEFGRGWSFDRASVHLVEPFPMPLIALPEAWTPGTDGPVRGEVVKVKLEEMDDLDAYRGNLDGKILLIDDPRDLDDHADPMVHRYDEGELDELTHFEIPGEGPGGPGRGRWLRRLKVIEALPDFLDDEGVVATIKASSRDAGIVRVGGRGTRDPEDNPGVPVLMMAVDHYNRLHRMAPDAERNPDPEPEEEEDEAEEGEEGEGEAAADEVDEETEAAGEPRPAPVVEIDVVARFHDDDLQGYNTLADLPGTDLADELVMVGAHLDSWHAATGAADNAAGSAIVMEAVRILAALDVKPRRTIRIALWSGEEQGLLGSMKWADRYLASRPVKKGDEDLPRFLQRGEGPLELHELHDKVSAYFNIDNGGGKIRGIYTQSNAALMPIFRAWLEPFHDLGATTVTNNDTGGTDHLAFDRVGVPGFQFIQDGLDYFSLTHHTNVDTYDHLRRDDMVQASVVLASFLYHAAMRDERLPRKPMPKDPEPES